MDEAFIGHMSGIMFEESKKPPEERNIQFIKEWKELIRWNRRRTGCPALFLKHIFEEEEITIGATAGTEKWEDLFRGGALGVDLPAYSGVTSPTTARIYDLMEDGKFKEFLPTLGENRLKWRNRGQVMAFCRDHKNRLREGEVFFFEFEDFVVAIFFLAKDRLATHVFPFLCEEVWSAKCERHIVSPTA